MGDLSLSQFEARIKFNSDADLSRWSGNTLRSGVGAHLRSLVCAQLPGLMSRLLFRANALAEFYGSGIMLYDNEQVLALLGSCRSISIVRANTEEIRAERYFHKQSMKKQHLPLFFAGEITYLGSFSRDHGASGAGKAHACGEDGHIWERDVRD